MLRTLCWSRCVRGGRHAVRHGVPRVASNETRLHRPRRAPLLAPRLRGRAERVAEAARTPIAREAIPRKRRAIYPHLVEASSPGCRSRLYERRAILPTTAKRASGCTLLRYCSVVAQKVLVPEVGVEQTPANFPPRGALRSGGQGSATLLLRRHTSRLRSTGV